MAINENTLVVDSEIINNIMQKNNFNSDLSIDKIKDVINNHGTFLSRDIAETDITHQQIIPYVILSNLQYKFLLVQRLKAQTESRLHNKYSIGLGGHINDKDIGENNWEKFIYGMNREIKEECLINNNSNNLDFHYLGLIKTDASPVDQVHTGLLFYLKDDVVGIIEKDKFTFEFTDYSDLISKYDSLEDWSKIVIQNWIIISLNMHNGSKI